MNIAIIWVTKKGGQLAGKIGGVLPKKHTVKEYCFYKYAGGAAESFTDIYGLTKKLFYENSALIFVCSCGIAVRAVSPLVSSKTADPAVIAVDDCGKFAVPLLSGHIGGANRLAQIIAEGIGAVPVITTATDTGGKFSPDLFAMANGLIISDMNAAKEIAAAVLNGENIGIKSDYPYGRLPPGFTEKGGAKYGIRISGKDSEKPFEVTLNLIPKNIVIGIGCKKNISCGTIEEQAEKAFSAAGLNAERICAAATADIKSGEKGLLEFCGKKGISLHHYSAEELMKTEGEFASSDFVMERTGTDNVCERSAVVHSGGRLVLPKYAGKGVTVAAAEIPIKLDFERSIF
ncbi:MAG: cobalamin biosynthesis protein [Ruminococcus sp.]|nr:cobalamin biosynthesis protein [Ruminococcus sp.]